MGARIPFPGDRSEYPPFLPHIPTEIDPVEPNERYTNPEDDPLFFETFTTPDGTVIEYIPDLDPLLPPPPPSDPSVKPSVVGDIPFFGGQHGDIAYRGPASWIFLSAGTSGQILKTQGTGADPVWADA